MYQYFSIQSELGQDDFSYSQPFFLSKTTMSEPGYTGQALKGFLERCGIKYSQASYESQGITVLRATIMNPYLLAQSEHTEQDLLKEFMEDLSHAADHASRRMLESTEGDELSHRGESQSSEDTPLISDALPSESSGDIEALGK